MCICVQLGEGGQRWGPRAPGRSGGADPVSMDLAFTVLLSCARHVHPDPVVSAERHWEGQRAQPRPPRDDARAGGNSCEIRQKSAVFWTQLCPPAISVKSLGLS